MGISLTRSALFLINCTPPEWSLGVYFRSMSARAHPEAGGFIVNICYKPTAFLIDDAYVVFDCRKVFRKQAYRVFQDRSFVPPRLLQRRGFPKLPEKKYSRSFKFLS